MKIIVKVLLMAGLLLAIVPAAGCGLLAIGQEDIQESTEDEGLPQEETETAQSQDLVSEITIWDCLEPKERIALIESSDRFVEENSIINVETRHFRSQEELEDQYEAASLAGAGPDLLLMGMDSVQRLAPGNVLKEVYQEINYGEILQGLSEISKYSGKNYIIPFRSGDFLVFYYNRMLVETPPSSFEEIFNYAVEVNDFENNYYGFLFNFKEADWIIPLIGGYGDWIVDYDTNSLTLDNGATVKALEFLDYLYNQEKLQPEEMEYEDIGNIFKEGGTAMIIDYYDTHKQYADSGLDLGIARIPRVWGSSKYPTPLISGIGFMININCYGVQMEAAKDFIGYMMSEKVQDLWNSQTDTLPALINYDRNTAFKEDSHLFESFQQAKISRGKPYPELLIAIRNAIRENTASVLAGDILPDEAALKIQEDAIRLRSGTAGTGDEEESINGEESQDEESPDGEN